MNVKSLDIWLGERRVGVLLQYPGAPGQVISRFVASDDFVRDSRQETLSLAYRASNPDAQASLWAGTSAALLNGALSCDSTRGWLLPAFFQNLLPEGPLRTRIAAMRGCGPEDHFDLLAASGLDLPGDVQALPAALSDAELSGLVARKTADLAHAEVSAPLAHARSLAGVQPKLPMLKVGGRFVTHTKHSAPDTVRNVIAKLPAPGFPLLPEIEDLSLRLARTAGVSVVDAELAPLALLDAEHGFDLGDLAPEPTFLAVYRYDRDAATPSQRIHCEDFAQILGVQPEAKYSHDYLTVAKVMMAVPSLGELAVLELLRRILVSDMLGNPDMHLKNIGVRYPGGRTPELPPAYDIVAYAAYGIVKHGRALHLFPFIEGEKRCFEPLSPVVVREFCTRLGMPEKPAWTALRRCAEKAFATWPQLIQEAAIPDNMKERLLKRLASFKPKAVKT